MIDYNIILPWDNLYKDLNIIRNIKFTSKEIDVISCLVSGKSSKSIAQILFISSKTVDSHIINITRKLDTNDRGSIISFVENTDKFSALKLHYVDLLNRFNFKNYLNTIKKTSKFINLKCSIYLITRNKDFIKYTHAIAQDLVDVNIKALINNDDTQVSLEKKAYILQESEIVIFKFEDTSLKQKNIREYYLVLDDREDNPNKISIINYNNYYKVFFAILNKIRSEDENYAEFFNKKYPIITQDLESLSREIPLTSLKLSNKTIFSKKNLLYCSFGLSLIILIILLSHKYLYSYISFPITDKETEFFNSIRSELALPVDTALLDRPYLIHQIKQNFSKQKGIQVVALVGVGGSGKTISARQYAFNAQNSVVWELKAENLETLYYSFEQLAYAFQDTPNDEKKLNDIKKIGEFYRKKNEILLFVKNKLRQRKNWLLIYDNASKLREINDFLPHDVHNWGEGSVLLTTQDSNIVNSNYINHIITVNELNSDEKKLLFCKVIKQNKFYNREFDQNNNVDNFLKNIPPYPLDVSLAAYYIKTTGINFVDYLKSISASSEGFLAAQQTILKDIGSYTKTRYGLISLSINKIINENEKFIGNLVLIALLNAQDIPVKLLKMHSSDDIVDNLIVTMNNYSLITGRAFSSNLESSFISMNPSTQQIALNYLKDKYDLKNDKNIIPTLVLTMENYLIKLTEAEQIQSINLLKGHYESFLKHSDVLSTEEKSYISYNLAYIYFLLGYYKEAIKFIEQETKLENGLENSKVAHIFVYLSDFYGTKSGYLNAKFILERRLEAHHKKKYQINNISPILSSLGFICIALGQYAESKKYFEQGLKICQENNHNNFSEIARNLTYLGVIEMNFGNYPKAKKLLEESLQYLNQPGIKNFLGLARSLTYLGILHECLGEYEKSKKLIEESIKIYQEYLPKHSIKIAWTKVNLGKSYFGLGDYETARNIFESCLKEYEATLPENHVFIARIKLHLGNTYAALGDFDNARKLIQYAINVYKKFYDENHSDTLQALCFLGKLHYLEGNINDAEDISNKALMLFKDQRNPKCLTCLNNLQKIYLKRLQILNEDADNFQKVKLIEKVQGYTKNMLDLLEQKFPKNSSILLQLQADMKKLQYE